MLWQVALIGMLAYLSYLCGELLGISGIVSLFCCGVVISHYVRRACRLPCRPYLYCLLVVHTTMLCPLFGWHPSLVR